MKQLSEFLKKEVLEQIRTGKFVIITILFCIFGIMNPAIAKLTPAMMSLLSEQLEESGLIVNDITVDASVSWQQFYKNMPIALIIFIVLFAGILINEYQKNTLLNILTKGMSRYKIILSKTVILSILWTFGYFLSYGITYAYNAYFWDNKILYNIGFCAFCTYFAGLWLISLIPLASSIAKSVSIVMLTCGGAYIVSYLISMLPKASKYMPTHLMDFAPLLSGVLKSSDYITAIIVTSVLILFNIILSILLFNKKQI